MSYIFKKGDIVRVKKIVGDDPSLMRENQIVESVKKIDVTDIDTYQVDLVGCGYLFTNHDLELINSAVTYPDSSEKSNILKVEDDIIDANLVEPETSYCISSKISVKNILLKKLNLIKSAFNDGYEIEF